MASSGVEEREVGVTDGRIAEVRKSGVQGAKRIKAGRCLIFPGFIDIHTHLREPGWEHKEDFRTGTEAAAHGGVTTVVDMPNNPVPATSRNRIQTKRDLASSKSVVDVRFYAGFDPKSPGDIEGCAPLVEGYKFYLAKTTGDGVIPKVHLEEALGHVRKTGKPACFHCEDQGVIDRKTAELHGVNRPDLHCDIRPPEAEIVSVRDTVQHLKSLPGISGNLCHLSTGEAVALASSARSEGILVDCEATLHHIYFNRKATLKSKMLKTNPPLRAEEDRQALLLGLSDGRVSFLVTDHAPHTVEEKVSEGLSGVPGLDDYGHIVSWLIKKQGFGPERIAMAASEAPARFLGLGDRGSIKVGLRADFTLLDLSSPEVVKAEGLRTKCGWSPYEGHEFPGRVKSTLVEGIPIVEDYEVV